MGKTYNSSNTRFGYNDKLSDGEVYGEKNFYDYGKRMYDPRLARFPSADPLIVKEQEYAWLSPYQYASNTPIQAIDIEGLQDFHFMYKQKNEEGLNLVSADKVPRADEKTKYYHWVKRGDKWYRFTPKRDKEGNIRIGEIKYEGTQEGKVIRYKLISQTTDLIKELKKEKKSNEDWMKEDARLAQGSAVEDVAEGAVVGHAIRNWVNAVENYLIGKEIDNKQDKVDSLQNVKQKHKPDDQN
jgi:RHS repeat-associated protein